MKFELIVIILISLAFGSFANNVISYYISLGKFDLLYSTCFWCKKRLKWHELIPLASFFLQKGKCTECKSRISIRYPIVEILTAVLAVITHLINGVSIHSVMTFLILYILLIISVIDFYKLIIPNQLTLILLLFTTTLLLLNSNQIIERIVYSIILAIILFSFTYLYEKFKGKIILGFGDIKLIFVLSLLLNFIDSMLALWISSVVGLAVVVLTNLKNISNLKTIKVPFGLYLSIGFTLVYLWNLKSDSLEFENILLSIWQMK